MDVELQMTFRKPDNLDWMRMTMDGNYRLDGKYMAMSVFFDRKVANEDNPFFDEFDLQ